MSYAAGYGQLTIPSISADTINCQQGVCIVKETVLAQELADQNRSGRIMGVAFGLVGGLMIGAYFMHVRMG